ncbi:hypothetical protein [Bhargavaea ginsengi]
MEMIEFVSILAMTLVTGAIATDGSSWPSWFFSVAIRFITRFSSQPQPA